MFISKIGNSMGNRGQKRAEAVEELPADKRACSSLEFRPSSSNSSVHTPVNSMNVTHHEACEGDMETSSSTSASTRSDGDGEKDSAYGSCDSDGHHGLRDYQRQRSASDQGKFKRVLSNLCDEGEPSVQLAALTELCELLSFCSDTSLSSLMADSLSPALVKLARHERSPDVMLLSIRAITYLCDAHPRSSGFLVRHDAVPALCQRLLDIEYLDVAEQCVQALNKISREQPLACLQSGAVMAVLNYIDFFSTSLQTVALSTVVNICKKLPSECPSPFMEAVPILCNLLQYEDRQLVENVATCLIQIAERVRHSSDMLDELCKHGLVHRATHLIDLNSRTTLCQPVYTGLIGLLVNLASGSFISLRTLFELNISNTLKDILSTYDLSHGMASPSTNDGHCNQVYEVLKLLNELLPDVFTDQDVQLSSQKQAFLVDHPDLVQKCGMDLLPVLVQVVISGVNLYVCYGCLFIINKLVYFSKRDMLLELLKSTNISSFLAGVFTRKDHHVLNLALQIVDTILQKLSDVFINSFVKEGVFFAIDALLMPEKCSQLMFPVLSNVHSSKDQSKKPSAKGLRCLCYAFDIGPCPSASELGACKLKTDSVYNLARHIRATYLTEELLNPEKGFTEIFRKLKNLSAALTDLVNKVMHDDSFPQHEEEFYYILHEIMSQLNGRDPISTFEFVESGIVKSLVNYLSNGQYWGKADSKGAFGQLHVIEKRFEVFGRFFWPSSGPTSENFSLSTLIHKLQNALASVESFHLVLSHASKQKNSYATVPCGRYIQHPSLQVQFVRDEGETCLSDYSGEFLSVDPFSSLAAIEGYLWPKVTRVESECTDQESGENGSSPSQLQSNANSPQGKRPDLLEYDSISPDMHVMQEDISPSEFVASNLAKPVAELTGMGEVQTDPMKQEESIFSEKDGDIHTECIGSCSKEDLPPKLLFYLEGKQVDRSLSLYQAILQQQIKAENEIISSSKLWSQVYKVAYRRATKLKQRCSERCVCHAHSTALKKSGRYQRCQAFLSTMFSSDLTSDLERSSPTYDILLLLRCLEGMNRFRFHLLSRERLYAFAEGRTDNLDYLKVSISHILQNEFVSSKLTEKLEQQMRDPLAVPIGGMPSWCGQLMASCPFLFSFEARCKYFRLAAFGQRQVQPQSSSHHTGALSNRQQNNGTLPRKKFLVYRNQILESASQMMERHASQKVLLEVEYNEEVGTGLGPTLEFYTLVSHEFQKSGLGMWREDYMPLAPMKCSESKDSGMLASAFGLFPRPWSSAESTSAGMKFSEVIKKFVLLGQVIAKALHDGRVLDIPFSKAFYKLFRGQELTVYDIHSFDPGLGTALLEFQALVERKGYVEYACQETSNFKIDSCFRNTRIEDLCLDFTLPGYPDYMLTSGPDSKMVNMFNLEEYISLVVDATINSGITRQMDAFRSGFNQVFPMKNLQCFTEEELECLLCGEREIWNSFELMDHIKFDHGYTASSPPIINLLDIIREFNREQQRAFLRFVTGAPQLPPGGLASLNPKLTIVRKHCSIWADADLPSVMTCANYLKLPPYSSKERMKEKLLYAITEGQGSFHLS